MYASVRALLNQIIDYAGLFPPAKLPMEEALREYAQARESSPHRWMLGRFVCPVAKLPDLLTWLETQATAPNMNLVVIGRQSSEAGKFSSQLAEDLDAVQDFLQEWGDEEAVDTFELALPGGVKIAALEERLGLAAKDLKSIILMGFLEVPTSEHWEMDLKEAAALVRIIQASSVSAGFGLKLRCGGLTVASIPSDEQIATFISICRQAQVPWKATAGLHHPRRHWDANLKVWHHGFLNVFIAGVLAYAHSLSESDIVEVLADRDGQHFHFAADALGWKKWSCTTAQIAVARVDFATSFGCCSFAEPCADLVAMGLLD